MSDIDLDCRGLACPEPVIRCRNLVDCEHPTCLTVLVDNAAASENVARQLGKNGYAVTTAQEKSDLWRICGQRAVQDDPLLSDVPSIQSSGDTFENVSGESSGKTLVLITTDTFGRGSDELGVRLMENFLATLPELGESLWKVVLLNGAVQLAAMPGKALDSLKALEASGVVVLVCGTCLSYYELLDEKAVGETTNMMDVVTSLALADKVIRP